MTLLEKIDLEIQSAKMVVKLFESPPDPDAGERQLGWIAGTLESWQIMLRTLQEIRKLTPIPAHIGHWIKCPECRADFDLEPEPPEFVLDDDGYYIWIGPSFCPACGQAIDLAALNVPDKDSTFGLPDVAVDLLRGMGMLGDNKPIAKRPKPTEDSDS